MDSLHNFALYLMMNRPLFVYATVCIFLIGWWSLAFRKHFSQPDTPICLRTISSEIPCAISSLPLSSLYREELADALRGNYALMIQKIVDWDIDAALLEESGVAHIQRMPAHLIQQAHYLLRQIESQNSIGSNETHKYLPQTYVSASILLTLLPPEAIAAIPAGLRKSTQLYPEELTAKIPFNFDKFANEKLYLMKPKLAFVSDFYSDPNRIQTLKNQGISIVYTSSISTIPDIKETLELIGEHVGKPLEARLLSIFIEACLIALENRLYASQPLEQINHILKHSLYVFYNTQFQLPPRLTVTHALLQRLGFSQLIESLQHKTHLAQEDILRINPDFLLVASSDKSHFKSLLQHYPALKELNAVKQQNMTWLDDTIQQTPTHHVLLAYFDLVNALAHMEVSQ